MYRYIFDVLPPKCTGTFLTYQNGLNVQYIFGGPPPLRGGDYLPTWIVDVYGFHVGKYTSPMDLLTTDSMTDSR